MLLFSLLKLLLSNPIQFVFAIIILFGPLLISITVHEWSHGFTAHIFGDPTPKKQGRLSLNPFKHLDPVGTLMLFLIGIGWAKPVEINPGYISYRFKNLKLMLIALAGPLSNFLMGSFFTFLLFIFAENIFVALLLSLIIRVNFVLGFFNLIPIPPLDGANIIANLLPEKFSRIYFKISPYSIPILLILIISGGIDIIYNLAENFQKFLIIMLQAHYH